MSLCELSGKRIFSFLLVAPLILVSLVVAEDSDRGRLSNGRAYRTDTQGNQIIDYIAELELGLEAKNRQVVGLEVELEEKQRTIDRLRSSSGKAAGVAERDLMKNSVPVERRHPAVSGAQDNCTSRLSALQAELKNSSKTLTVAKADLKIGQKISDREKEELQSAVTELQQIVAGKDDELRLLRTKMKAAQTTDTLPTTTRVEREPVKSVPITEKGRSRSDQKASLSPAAIRGKRAEVANKQLSASRVRAVESMKGSLRNDLNRTRSLVATRDKMYKSFRASGKTSPVQFQPSKAMSSRKLSLTTLRSKIDKASTVYELNRYRSDIREIQEQMNDDISLIRRLVDMG